MIVPLIEKAMKSPFRVICTLLLLLVVLGMKTATSQVRETDVKFRLAQSYERSGDFEAAVKLYEELYPNDSSNPVLFESLRRGYMQLKRYDPAITLLAHRLDVTPNDLSLLAQLGTLYILKSDDTRATAAWERAIATDPKNEMTYRIVASAIIESRLFEKAIALYKRARVACGNPVLFITDIAYLHALVLDYAGATREYLNLLVQSPVQLGYVQSRLSSFTGKPDGLAAAIAVVREAVNSEQNNTVLQQLLAWTYMEGKRYGEAYTVYKNLDRLTNASGHELYNFAQRALNERAYDAAAKAFQDILASHQQFDRLAEVKFGYARTLEESTALRDTASSFTPFGSDQSRRSVTESASMYTDALAAFMRVTFEHPNTEVAARSLLRVAMLKQDRFFDLDGARTSLEQLLVASTAFPELRLEATLRLADLMLTAGNLDKAEVLYQKVLLDRAHTPSRDRATFRLGEIDYFRGNIPDAIKKLQELSRNAGADITNNALGLMIFLQESEKDDPGAIRAFAKADFLKRQRKFSEARNIFDDLTKSYPKAECRDEAMMNIGDLLALMGRTSDAIDSYQRLIADFPESILLDAALMKLGTTYEKALRDPLKAAAAYQQLLERFPNSIHANEARKRVRGLRGDTI